ncbi:MAG: L-histidine N(alpha)-methyltransferase [Nitrospiraceae bacterium]|nr:MAG: L-histidine N(alpha)-methyltransferase [Nitrospiraceae bacterium]
MDSQIIFKQSRMEVHNHMSDTYREEIAKDVFRGLTAPRKFIPSKYFYDARGSELFDQICSLPEYYPTRTEMAILRHAAPAIMGSFEQGDIVELGSGANLKIRMLLDAAPTEHLSQLRYVPVDVSTSALVDASEELLTLYPDLEVLGIVADFTLHLDKIPSDRPRLLLFLGSTIGNFSDAQRHHFLRSAAFTMNPRDRFLIGFDMLKPAETLEAAYNDSVGITSRFNKNVLHVLNRELKANFDPSDFEHLAFFNQEKQRVEMHLQARHSLEVMVDDLGVTVELEKNETIHTEICGKFSKSGVEKLADESGLKISRWFFDTDEWFSLAELTLKERR